MTVGRNWILALQFEGCVGVDATGKSGNLLLFWKEPFSREAGPSTPKGSNHGASLSTIDKWKGKSKVVKGSDGGKRDGCGIEGTCSASFVLRLRIVYVFAF